MTYEEFNRAEELPPWVDRMIEDFAPPEPAAQRKVKVQIGGYLEAEGSGGQVARQFHTETLTLLIPDNYFGWGDREAIDAQIASLRPGFIALDHWAA